MAQNISSVMMGDQVVYLSQVLPKAWCQNGVRVHLTLLSPISPLPYTLHTLCRSSSSRVGRATIVAWGTGAVAGGLLLLGHMLPLLFFAAKGQWLKSHSACMSAANKWKWRLSQQHWTSRCCSYTMHQCCSGHSICQLCLCTISLITVENVGYLWICIMHF